MSEMKYTETHEWIKLEDDIAIIGITSHAQELLGDLVFVELPKPGSRFDVGQEFGVVESVKAASDVYAPVSGTIISVNSALDDNPSLINEDPEGKGWLVKIRLENPDDVQKLLSWDSYQQTMAEEH